MCGERRLTPRAAHPHARDAMSNATAAGVFLGVSLVVIMTRTDCPRLLARPVKCPTNSKSGPSSTAAQKTACLARHAARIRFMPAIEDKPPEYRIKHFSEEFERVAFENEIIAGESEHGQR